MNKIKSSELNPGMIFSEPVYSEGTNILVPAMVPLRKKDIDLLSTWGIEFVNTDGHIIEQEPDAVNAAISDGKRSSSPAGASRFLRSSGAAGTSAANLAHKKETIKFSITDVQQNSGPYRAYKNLIEKLAGVFTSIKSGVDVEMRAINNIGTQLLQDLRDNTDSFIDYILGGEISGHELAKSSINTAILSALTAQELKLPNHKIMNIVAGALLHDIGMIRLSKGITEKKGGLSDAELEQIKSHPLHTSKIITKELFGPHEVNLIALQHHERWDGKGYPDKIMGPAIDLGARIVSVADAFEAMVSKKSYRNSLMGYQAVKNLLADNARRFDPAIIIAFTKIMGIYPIGSIVRLNDDSVARVTNVHTDAPLRPIVQMLVDKYGKILKPGEGADIDLLEDKRLFIKNAIDPEDFSLSDD
ncbi:MAG: HD-GYP domain-containing protein [Treponema sp.]|jgi:HD-GYP domain-containing protein (c-di-GMP phosphodiesterase class II)|nr:HD-GYP domain-containing protein [Treponema sp.]